MKHLVKAETSTASMSANPLSDHDRSPPSMSGTPSSLESSIASSGNEILDAKVNLATPSKQCQKERKCTMKGKVAPKDTGEEEAVSIQKSLESIESKVKSSLLLWRVCCRTMVKKLEMMASFMGSLLEAIKDKK